MGALQQFAIAKHPRAIFAEGPRRGKGEAERSGISSLAQHPAEGPSRSIRAKPTLRVRSAAKVRIILAIVQDALLACVIFLACWLFTVSILDDKAYKNAVTVIRFIALSKRNNLPK